MATQLRNGDGLTAVQCSQCELVVYPDSVTICPRCTASPLHPVAASGDGFVWSYTVQRFEPKSPPYRPGGGGFEPFIVAYVETADGIRIEGIISDVATDAVHIGMPVRLVSCDDVPRFVPELSLTAETGQS
jgi:uncharacterized protein